MKKFAAWLKTTRNGLIYSATTLAAVIFLCSEYNKQQSVFDSKADCRIKKVACAVADSIVDSSLSPVVSVVCDQTMSTRKIELSLDELLSNGQKAKIQTKWTKDSLDFERYFSTMKIKKRRP